mmetsp:Transcript_53470/g.153432  ORF Transcript_53470/g.153432 Transcript_53470/m.153432 type:complete len:217 (-) Transcript_53470:101-751(-)
MPVWQNVNLKQKAIFEIIQGGETCNLPYYLQGEELDFFIRGIAQGPHAKTYLPQLVEREKSPIYIARGHAPPTYSRVVKLRFYGPDPVLKDAGPNWPAGQDGELMEYIIGWRWLYAYWDGPLVDEVDEAWNTKMWPEVAKLDWTWETLKFLTPPYWVPDDGKPWRIGRNEAYPIRVVKGKGKGGKSGAGSSGGDVAGRGSAVEEALAAKGAGKAAT